MKKVFGALVVLATGVAAAMYFFMPKSYESNLEALAEELKNEQGVLLTYDTTETGSFGSSFTINNLKLDAPDEEATITVGRLDMDGSDAFFQNMGSLLSQGDIAKLDKLTLNRVEMNNKNAPTNIVQVQKIEMTNVDAAALQNLLDAQNEPTQASPRLSYNDIPFETLDLQTISANGEDMALTLDGLRVSTPQDRLVDVQLENLDLAATQNASPVTVTLASLSVEDYYIPEFPEFVAPLESENPSPEELAAQRAKAEAFAAELRQTMSQTGMKAFALRDLKARADANQAELALDALDFSSSDENIYNFSMDQLSLDAATPAAPVNVSLGSIKVDDLYLPSFVDLMDGLEPPRTVDEDIDLEALAAKRKETEKELLRRILQTHLKSFSINNFQAKSEGMFEASLADISYTLEGRVGAQGFFLPSQTKSQIKALEINLGPIGAMMAAGINPDLPTTYKIDAEGVSNWDTQSGDLSGEGTFTMDGLLSYTANGQFIGFTEQAYTDYLNFIIDNMDNEEPTSIDTAALMTKFGDVGAEEIEINITDFGALSLAQSIMAKQTGMPEEMVPDMMKAMIAGGLAQMAPQMPEAQALSDALTAFVDGSKTLSIRLAPSDPVTLGAFKDVDVTTP